MVNKLIVLLIILVCVFIYYNLSKKNEGFDSDILSIIEKSGNIKNTADVDERRDLTLKKDVLDTSQEIISQDSSVSNKIVNDTVLKEFVIKQLGPRSGGNNDNYILEGDNKQGAINLNTNLDLDKVIRENTHKIFSKITNQNMILKNLKLELLKLIHSDIDPDILRKRKACIEASK